MNQNLALISLVVKDYDEAIDYYVNTLGFILTEDTLQPEQNKRWIVVTPPGSACGILLARASTAAQEAAIGNQTGGRVFLFLHTNDIQRDFERYSAAGVIFIRPPRTQDFGIAAVFRDLYGNLWDLVEKRAL